MALQELDILDKETTDTKELTQSKSISTHKHMTLVQVYFVAKDDAF